MPWKPKKLIAKPKKKRRYAPDGPRQIRHKPQTHMMFGGDRDYWEVIGDSIERSDKFNRFWENLALSKKEEKKTHKARLRDAEITLEEIHAAQQLMKEVMK